MGVNDFHLENIGDVTVARFSTDTQRKRLHFATVRARTPDAQHAIALAAPGAVQQALTPADSARRST